MMKITFFSGSLLVLVLIFASCNTNFDPLEENDELIFSMYGVFDVHADTHWVRIMPIGTSLFPTNPDVEPVDVRLTDNITGESWVLQDSLFRFGSNTYVYNYLFADSVQPNQTYTLTATATDGRQSRVIIDTPSELAIPEVDYSDRNESTRMSGFTMDSVVVVDVKFLVQPIAEDGACMPETEVSFSIIHNLIQRSNGSFYVFDENRGSIREELGTPYFIVNKRSMVIATSISDWPNTTVLDELEVAIPGVVSNVENGTGVVAGIARQEVILSPRRSPC